jgi:hypothetical protein
LPRAVNIFALPKNSSPVPRFLAARAPKRAFEPRGPIAARAPKTLARQSVREFFALWPRLPAKFINFVSNANATDPRNRLFPAREAAARSLFERL